MKIIIQLYILQFFLSFNLFSIEFDSYYQKNYHYLMVGKDNAKIGLNFAYSNFERDYDQDIYIKTINFGGTQKTSFGPSTIGLNYIPYQPSTSGLSFIYGLTDNFQIFFSGDIYEKYYYSQDRDYFEEYNDEKYIKSTIVDKSGTPILGFSINIPRESGFFLISPYITVPFYQNTESNNKQLKNNKNDSFEQNFGIGIYLNFSKFYENLFFELIYNFYAQNQTDKVSPYSEYNIGAYLGYILSEDIDIIKVGFITQKDYSSNHEIFEDNSSLILKFDLIFMLNIFDYYFLNFELWNSLLSDRMDISNNFGLGLQIEYKF